MIDGQRRCRSPGNDTCHQQRQNEIGELTHHGLARQNVAPSFVDGDQRDYGSKRHLEAGFEQAFRPENQNGERRPGDQTQCQRPPVDDNAQQNHPGHHKGPERGDCCPCDHRIAECRQHRRNGRPLFDRVSERDGRNKSQQETRANKHKPCDHADVQAGNCQKMGQARIPHSLQVHFWNGSFLSCHECGCKGRNRRIAKIFAHRIADDLAHILERLKNGKRCCACRVDDPHCPQRKTGGTDVPEPGIALEIKGPRCRW